MWPTFPHGGKNCKIFEFSPGRVPPPSANSVEEIRAAFEKNVRTAEELLSTMTEQSALGTCRLTLKGKVIFSKPRVAVLRTNLLNHLYHHRGQSSV
ncbi:MAG TPA: hypothetical protein VN868_00705 [Terriglobales bacterium]|nr:hypothetical protein [Terriglobales bacterium]